LGACAAPSRVRNPGRHSIRDTNVGGLSANRAWTDQIPGDLQFGRDFGRYTQNGVLAGQQAGCNYQLGGWVVGVQADYYGFGSTRNTFLCAACGLAAAVAPFNITSNISTLKAGLNFSAGFVSRTSPL
jgi:hypothetical protein